MDQATLNTIFGGVTAIATVAIFCVMQKQLGSMSDSLREMRNANRLQKEANDVADRPDDGNC
jgi:hypothetical protein